jgi:hypothetical protein
MGSPVLAMRDVERVGIADLLEGFVTLLAASSETKDNVGKKGNPKAEVQRAAGRWLVGGRTASLVLSTLS